MSWGMTRDEKVSVEMTPCLSREVVLIGKSVRTTSSGNEESEAKAEDNLPKLNSPRKLSQPDLYQIVPITDTGGLVG